MYTKNALYNIVKNIQKYIFSQNWNFTKPKKWQP